MTSTCRTCGHQARDITSAGVEEGMQGKARLWCPSCKQNTKHFVGADPHPDGGDLELGSRAAARG